VDNLSENFVFKPKMLKISGHHTRCLKYQLIKPKMTLDNF
jgi:hypothetical protein